LESSPPQKSEESRVGSEGGKLREDVKPEQPVATLCVENFELLRRAFVVAETQTGERDGIRCDVSLLRRRLKLVQNSRRLAAPREGK
jgi:hypothetical protein